MLNCRYQRLGEWQTAARDACNWEALMPETLHFCIGNCRSAFEKQKFCFMYSKLLFICALHGPPMGIQVSFTHSAQAKQTIINQIDAIHDWHASMVGMANSIVHFISKPRGLTHGNGINAVLVLCETKRSRHDFPLFQAGKRGLVKISTSNHVGCKFVHLGPLGTFGRPRRCGCSTTRGRTA